MRRIDLFADDEYHGRVSVGFVRGGRPGCRFVSATLTPETEVLGGEAPIAGRTEWCFLGYVGERAELPVPVVVSTAADKHSNWNTDSRDE